MCSTCRRHQDADDTRKCDENVGGTPELRATIELVPFTEFAPRHVRMSNASRPSEHPPVMGEKISKRLGRIIGCKYKTSS